MIPTARYGAFIFARPRANEIRLAPICTKAAIPRCLTGEQRTTFYLLPELPAWCIEMEKVPYQTVAWKEWLVDIRAGKNPSLPSVR
jgi:hypothetical protein